jgi:hypothetical protein
MTSCPAVARSATVPTSLRGAVRPVRVPSVSTVAAAFVVLAHLLIALATAWHAPFPTEFDELQHLSVVRAQREAPSLFPDHRTERILSLPSLAAWTDKPNYIPHPPLYYLALAPLSGAPAPSVLTLRLANAAMSAAALCLVLLAGRRLFPTEAGRVVFALMAAAFPKAAVIGGMINNDNLAMLAAALVFAGLAGARGGLVLVAAGLALAGWSKLTAIVALGTVTLAWPWIEGRLRDAAWARSGAILGAGGAIGLLPSIVTFARTGHLLDASTAQFHVPLGERANFGFLGYAADFIGRLVLKWPAVEGATTSLPAAAALAVLMLCAVGFGLTQAGRGRAIAMAFVIGLAATFAIHLWFGWRAFQELGDLTIAQTRYYGVLWPGLSVALTAAALRAGEWTRGGTAAIVALVLLPTLPGVVIASALAR